MRSRAAFLLLLFVPGLLAATPNQAIISRIPRTRVESRAITSVGYSKRLHALEIEFRNGAIYRYLEVPVKTYVELMAAPSKPGYYDTNIRHHFHSLHVKPDRGAISASSRP